MPRHVQRMVRDFGVVGTRGVLDRERFDRESSIGRDTGSEVLHRQRRVAKPRRLKHLSEGMSGNAKILVGRRSLAEFAWRFARDLVGRRM
jgi:hypothetical protein